MKQLIIDADDFGLCESVNQGIVECLQCGIVTDLSFLIHLEEFNSSSILLKEIGKTSVGFHLNLTLGKSVLGAHSNLTDENGNYFDFKTLIKKIILKEIKPNDITYEIKSQIDLLLKNGFSISHINSHRNIHLLPNIMKPLKEVLKEYAINTYIRIPQEGVRYILRSKKLNVIRGCIFKLFAIYYSIFTNYNFTIKTIGSDFFNNPQLSKAFFSTMSSITKSSCRIFEIPVHPGHPSSILRKYDTYSSQRKWELDFLKSKIDLGAGGEKIYLANFNDI